MLQPRPRPQRRAVSRGFSKPFTCSKAKRGRQSSSGSTLTTPTPPTASPFPRSPQKQFMALIPARTAASATANHEQLPTLTPGSPARIGCSRSRSRSPRSLPRKTVLAQPIIHPLCLTFTGVPSGTRIRPDSSSTPLMTPSPEPSSSESPM